MAPHMKLSCIALNDRGTFSQGDTLGGTLILTLNKDTYIKSLFVKAKGEARVRWSEGSGDNRKTHSAHQRYFKLKDIFIAENAQGTVLSQGIHRFKFRFKIPEGDMPSSFRGLHGWIAYTLEAKLFRSWLFPSKVKQEINFVSKSIPPYDKVMCPQSGSVNKETGVFSKGQVQLSATVDRRFCSPGDTLSVVAKICNSSSKTMRPKFKLQQVTVYRAGRSTNSSTNVLYKIIGDTIAPNSEETVPCQLQIPADAIHTLYNCEIISVDYYVKVYLDISFSIDPGLAFTLLIIPSYIHHSRHPYPDEATEAPSNSNFPPPKAFGGSCPAGASGGTVNSRAPGLSGRPYPASTNSGYFSAQSCPAPQAASPNNRLIYAVTAAVSPPQPEGMSYRNPASQQGSPYASLSSSSLSAELHPPSPVSAFPPPNISPPPYSSLLNMSPAPPAYNLLPSARMDFLSQTDEAPPAYSLYPLPSDMKKTDSKE